MNQQLATMANDSDIQIENAAINNEFGLQKISYLP